MPTQMPRNGRPRADHRLAERVFQTGHGGEAAPAIGEGADAGQDDAVGAATSRGGWSPDHGGMPLSAAARSKAFAAERRLPEP